MGWDLRKMPAIQLCADWRSGAMLPFIAGAWNCQALGCEEGFQVDAKLGSKLADGPNLKFRFAP